MGRDRVQRLRLRPQASRTPAVASNRRDGRIVDTPAECSLLAASAACLTAAASACGCFDIDWNAAALAASALNTPGSRPMALHRIIVARQFLERGGAARHARIGRSFRSRVAERVGVGREVGEAGRVARDRGKCRRLRGKRLHRGRMASDRVHHRRAGLTRLRQQRRRSSAPPARRRRRRCGPWRAQQRPADCASPPPSPAAGCARAWKPGLAASARKFAS